MKEKHKAILHRKKGYSSAMMMFLTGPVQKPQDENETVFAIKLGRLTHYVIGDAQKGLPYGLVSRLIKLWIDTEIIYSSYGRGNVEKDYITIKNERVVSGYKLTIPDSLSDFLINCLGLSSGSVDIKELQNQLVRMASVKFRTSFKEDDGSLVEETNNFINNSRFSWLDNGELGKSYFYIDSNYFKNIVENHRFMVLDMALVKKFIRTIEGIDIYRFVKHISCTLKVASIEIPIKELQEQLQDSSPSDNFIKKIRKIIAVINKDSLVNAEVISSLGRSRHSFLKINSTKHLISKELFVKNK